MTDGSGFDSFYEEHVWEVYGFFGYRVGSREDAEDLTQLTFERALKAWDRFDETRASASTWLMTIARNLLVDHYRHRSSRREEPRDPNDPARPEPASDPPQDRSLGISPELEGALGMLDERQRELIALRYGADLSGAEIAELTGLSLANVQQIASRALRKLRSELDRAEESAKDEPSRRGTA
jgi:RNA polymerase sigma-70 factor, ECF subfamily